MIAFRREWVIGYAENPHGELILAGGTGNGYRLAELASASNPSGWSGVIKVKTPTGTTLGYILLYTNP